eukprot:2888838-Prymnesium_polylepis.3
MRKEIVQKDAIGDNVEQLQGEVELGDESVPKRQYHRGIGGGDEHRSCECGKARSARLACDKTAPVCRSLCVERGSCSSVVQITDPHPPAVRVRLDQGQAFDECI